MESLDVIGRCRRQVSLVLGRDVEDVRGRVDDRGAGDADFRVDVALNSVSLLGMVVTEVAPGR